MYKRQVTGHPVDVASGTFFTDEEDCWLDGPVPLSWERTWYSRSDYRGPLGNGWPLSSDRVRLFPSEIERHIRTAF